MSVVVNFSVPKNLERQIVKTVRSKGFASKAEFFRFAALFLLGNLGQPKSLDEILHEARQDYAAGNFRTAHTAKELLRGLKS